MSALQQDVSIRKVIMKTFNICTKRTYEKDGEQKNLWLNVGKLKETDDGKRFIELNMFPNTPFYAFEPKPKDGNAQVNWDE